MPTTLHQIPRKLWVDLGRAYGGAIIFALPMLMTMEMWHLGFHMERLHLVVLLLVFVPFLTVLDRYSGFEATSSWVEDLRDALVAYFVGFTASAVILGVFHVLDPQTMSLREIIGKICIQAVPASMGAVLARTQLGQNSADTAEAVPDRAPLWVYLGELFIMGAGALFLAFNLAPTEEIVLISLIMTPWHMLGLFALSLALMHVFVYGANYTGQARVREGHTQVTEFFIFTVPGYCTALAVSFCVLSLLDQTAGFDLYHTLGAVIVLGFPSAIGAAAARLIL